MKKFLLVFLSVSLLSGCVSSVSFNTGFIPPPRHYYSTTESVSQRYNRSTGDKRTNNYRRSNHTETNRGYRKDVSCLSRLIRRLFLSFRLLQTVLAWQTLPPPAAPSQTASAPRAPSPSSAPLI